MGILLAINIILGAGVMTAARMAFWDCIFRLLFNIFDEEGNQTRIIMYSFAIISLFMISSRCYDTIVKLYTLEM